MHQPRSIRTPALAGLLLVAVAGCGGQGPGGEGGAGVDTALAASWTDGSLTLAEVDAHVNDSDIRVLQQHYEARRAALEQLIVERLLEEAAEERGTTPEELIEAEVGTRLKPVTDEDVAEFYEHNKQVGRIEEGKSLEEMTPALREFLMNFRRQEARQTFLAELRSEADVTIELEPPRTDITAGAEEPSLGPEDAPIQIVEFSDFECPYCARIGPVLKKVHDTYGDLVRVSFMDLPLSMHAQAQIAAEAAQCANDQGRFWEYHDALFGNQRALQAEDLKRHAADIGLDAAAFAACLDEGVHRAEVLQDAELAASMGVNGTPAMFINGIFVNGVRPYEELKRIIDEELKRRGIEPPA